MSADRVNSRPAPARFAFWSQGELARIGMIGCVALCPMLVGTRQAPADTGSSAASVSPTFATAPQAGQLRSVRIVDFNLRALDGAALGDEEPVN
jgi:hypothetical protein